VKPRIKQLKYGIYLCHSEDGIKGYAQSPEEAHAKWLVNKSIVDNAGQVKKLTVSEAYGIHKAEKELSKAEIIAAIQNKSREKYHTIHNPKIGRRNKMKLKTPYTDINGIEIWEGDIIEHEISKERGLVVRKHLGGDYCQWLVHYGNEDYSSLKLQTTKEAQISVINSQNTAPSASTTDLAPV